MVTRSATLTAVGTALFLGILYVWATGRSATAEPTDDASCDPCTQLPELCRGRTLAVRFGDPRQKSSRTEASEGEEIEVVLALDLLAETPLDFWTVKVGDALLGEAFELLEARTHEVILALAPVVEETRIDGHVAVSDVLFNEDIRPHLPAGTTTLPLLRARFRVLSLDAQSPRVLQPVWVAPAPSIDEDDDEDDDDENESRRVSITWGLVFSREHAPLHTVPYLSSETYIRTERPTQLVASANGDLWVDGPEENDLREIRCVLPGAPPVCYYPQLYPSSPVFDARSPAAEYLVGTDPETRAAVILRSPRTPIVFEGRERLENPGALHALDAKLYLADIPRQRVFVAYRPSLGDSTYTLEPIFDLPTPPHSLAVSDDTLYIGGQTDGAIRVFDLQSETLDEEPLITGLGPLVSVATAPTIYWGSDEYWGTDVYTVPREGPYQGKLIAVRKRSIPRVLADGFEGRVELAFDSSEFQRSDPFHRLYASELERDRITRFVPRWAGDVWFAGTTNGLTRRYRDSIQSFASGVSVSGLAVDTEAVVWGAGYSLEGEEFLYRVDNPFGDVVLVKVAPLSELAGVSAIEWIGSDLVAAAPSPLGGSALFFVDSRSGDRNAVGEDGTTGLSSVAGLAFDRVSQRLYALETNGRTLHSIDWSLEPDENPLASPIGPTGLEGVTVHGLALKEETGELLASTRLGNGELATIALDPETAVASFPASVAPGPLIGASGAFATLEPPLRSNFGITNSTLTSSAPAAALRVSGTVRQELEILNLGPPAFDSAIWGPVERRSDDRGDPFRCAEVDEPLFEGFVSAREFLRDIDEVSLDNCSSAFYRYTFELPPIFENAWITGVANVDDQAVVFLNGRRISSAMTDPGCEPDPGNLVDPCYDLQQTGRDAFGDDGRRSLTAPTQDPFGTNDSASFLPGVNELVFAVAGNASPHDPTGLEFAATFGVDTPSALPQVVVTSIEAPSAAMAGEFIEIRWEVTNVGFASTEASWQEVVGQTVDLRNATGARIGWLGSVPFEGVLAPGESVERVASFEVPRTSGACWVRIGFSGQTVEQLSLAHSPFRRPVTDDRPISISMEPGPDLLVTKIVVPGGEKPLLAGTTTEVSYTIVNAGDLPTEVRDPGDSWTDLVHLINDPETCVPMPEPDDCDFDFVRSTAKRLLPPGEGYTLTVPLRLPEKLATTYYALVRVDYGDAVAESNEGNNFLVSGPFKAVISDAQPDLVAEDIRFPAEVFSGTRVRIHWSDANHGSGRTDINVPGSTTRSFWSDEIYLSTDQEPAIGPDDVFLRSVDRRAPALVSGAREAKSLEVLVPLTFAGTAFVKVVVDASDRISEFGLEGNNVGVSTSALQVVTSPPVDLAPVSFTVPNVVVPGREISISWEVENIGAPSLPESAFYSHVDRVFLGDRLLEEVSRQGVSYFQTQTVFVPLDVPPGPTELRLEVDASGRIPEESEANNILSHSVLLEDQAPDLAVEVLDPHPTELVAGSSFPLRWRVTNVGKGTPSRADWKDTVSVRPAGSGLTRELLRLPAPRSLAPGESYESSASVTLNWPALQLAPGAYEIIVATDATHILEREKPSATRGNNTVVIPVTSRPNTSDVTVASVTWEPTSGSQDILNVRFAEQNISPTASVDSWTLSVFGSYDEAYDPSHDLFLGATSGSRLDPGESAESVVEVDVSPFGDTSVYLIITSDRIDANMANNTRGVAGPSPPPASPPTLDVEVHVAEPVVAGRQAMVGWNVTITGPPTNLQARLILSPDTKGYEDHGFLGPDDVYLGSANGDGSEAEAWSSQKRFQIPTSVRGPRFLILDIRAFEVNTVLATKAAYVGVEVNPVPQTDLEVVEIVAPSTGVLGDSIAVRWHTSNAGPDLLDRVAWSDSLYLSADPTWDLNDTFLGRFEIDPARALTVGDSEVFNASPTLEGIEPGVYYMLVRTDVFDQVAEPDETNNLSASAETITVSARRLELGVPWETTLVMGDRRHFEIADLPAGETLRVRLDHGSPVMHSELYVRHGQPASPGRFDRRFRAPGEPDQLAIVPRTESGSYFVMARSSGVTTTTAARKAIVLAEVLPFQVDSVTPDRVGTPGRVTLSIEGSRFVEKGTVRLETTNGNSVAAQHVDFIDATRVRATFLLDDELYPAGTTLDILVTGEGGDVAQFPAAVTLEESTGPLLELTAPLSPGVRAGPTPGTLTLPVTNRGNVDADYVFLMNAMEHNRGREIASTSASSPFHGSDSTFEQLETHAMLRALAPGETGLLISTVRPGDDTGSDIILGSGVAWLSVERFIESEAALAEVARKSVLENPAGNEHLLEAAVDSESWRQLWFDALVRSGQVHFADLEALQPTPTSAGDARCVTARKKPENPPDFCDELEGMLCEVWQSYRFGLGMAAVDAESPRPAEFPCGLGEVVACGLCSVWPIARAVDPNEKTGSDGTDAENFVPKGRPIRYRVDFENVVSAAAPAATVRITDPIDPALLPSSFRLERIAFGDTIVDMEEETITFQKRLDLSASHGVFVDVLAGLDPVSSEAFWSFRSVDPGTLEPSVDPQTGFLPPNDADGRGRGWVEYSLRPRLNALGGVIRNEATIRFDAARPETTNEVLHTLDPEPPTSRIDSLASLDATTIALSWSGEDPVGGSGLGGYSIYVSVDGAPFRSVVHRTTETSGTFAVVPGRQHSFYSIAFDRAGNIEEPPLDADVQYPTHRFLRGDCNSDGAVAGQVTDAVFLLTWSFLDGRPPGCVAACDVDGDGRAGGQVTDAVYLLNFNFLEGAPPPPPYPDCGGSTRESDLALGCEQADSCR